MKRKYLILFLISFSVILLDQVTKYLITESFRLGDTLPIIPDFFNLSYVQNKGAAFGILATADPAFRVPFFMVVPILALISIGFLFKKIAKEDLRLAIALSLVIGGAIGNLIDRLLWGYVIDFLDFHWRWGYHFPAFNVADSAICVGVALVILDLFRSEEVVRMKTRSDKDASSTP